MNEALGQGLFLISLPHAVILHFYIFLLSLPRLFVIPSVCTDVPVYPFPRIWHNADGSTDPLLAHHVADGDDAFRYRRRRSGTWCEMSWLFISTSANAWRRTNPHICIPHVPLRFMPPAPFGGSDVRVGKSCTVGEDGTGGDGIVLHGSTSSIQGSLCKRKRLCAPDGKAEISLDFVVKLCKIPSSTDVWSDLKEPGKFSSEHR